MRPRGTGGSLTASLGAESVESQRPGSATRGLVWRQRTGRCAKLEGARPHGEAGRNRRVAMRGGDGSPDGVASHGAGGNPECSRRSEAAESRRLRGAPDAQTTALTGAVAVQARKALGNMASRRPAKPEGTRRGQRELARCECNRSSRALGYTGRGRWRGTPAGARGGERCTTEIDGEKPI